MILLFEWMSLMRTIERRPDSSRSRKRNINSPAVRVLYRGSRQVNFGEFIGFDTLTGNYRRKARHLNRLNCYGLRVSSAANFGTEKNNSIAVQFSYSAVGVSRPVASCYSSSTHRQIAITNFIQLAQ